MVTRIGFIRIRWVHSGATWTVYSGWLGSLVSLKRVLGVIGFIRVLWVHSGEPMALSCSFGFVGFIQAQPGCRRVHSGSLGSFERALGIHLDAPWVSSGLFGLVGYIRALT